MGDDMDDILQLADSSYGDESQQREEQKEKSSSRSDTEAADETDVAQILHEDILRNELRAHFTDLDIIAERQKGYGQPREFLIRAVPLWHRSGDTDKPMRDAWGQEKKHGNTKDLSDDKYSIMIVKRGNLKLHVPEKASSPSSLEESSKEMLENMLAMSNDGPDWFDCLSRQIFYVFADAKSKEIAAKLGHDNVADYLVHLYDHRLYHEKQEKSAYKRYQQEISIQLAAIGTHVKKDPPILNVLDVFEIRFTSWRRVSLTQILDPFEIEIVKNSLKKIIEHAPHMLLAQTWIQALAILIFSEQELETKLNRIGIVVVNKSWISEAHMDAIRRYHAKHQDRSVPDCMRDYAALMEHFQRIADGMYTPAARPMSGKQGQKRRRDASTTSYKEVEDEDTSSSSSSDSDTPMTRMPLVGRGMYRTRLSRIDEEDEIESNKAEE